MRVLAIGDIHLPAAHPGYLPFCRDLYVKNKCNLVVFLGDIVDWHSISFHARHPEARGPQDELEAAYKAMRPWVKTFPKAKVCIGNHDARIIRLSESVNIPASCVKSYKELWDTPGWDWQDEHIVDSVYYFHGVGSAGIHPAFTSMQRLLMSVVQGHVHSAAGIKWRANPERRIFGMDVGCGVDDKQVAFAYGQKNQIKSMLSAGVILDGVPYHHIMQIGSGEKYNKKRFK